MGFERFGEVEWWGLGKDSPLQTKVQTCMSALILHLCALWTMKTSQGNPSDALNCSSGQSPLCLRLARLRSGFCLPFSHGLTCRLQQHPCLWSWCWSLNHLFSCDSVKPDWIQTSMNSPTAPNSPSQLGLLQILQPSAQHTKIQPNTPSGHVRLQDAAGRGSRKAE